LNMTKLLSFRFDNICCKMKDSRCVCIPFIHENTINTYDRNGRIPYT